MVRLRPTRIALAAWLGILALAVQALIPVLLAAEIEIAATEGGKSVFTLCAFGHLHVTQPSADGKAPQPTGDDDRGTVCPICIALQAAPPFTAPSQIALPLPASFPIETVITEQQPAAKNLTTAAYRSRAPPLA